MLLNDFRFIAAGCRKRAEHEVNETTASELRVCTSWAHEVPWAVLPAEGQTPAPKPGIQRWNVGMSTKETSFRLHLFLRFQVFDQRQSVTALRALIHYEESCAASLRRGRQWDVVESRCFHQICPELFVSRRKGSDRQFISSSFLIKLLDPKSRRSIQATNICMLHHFLNEADLMIPIKVKVRRTINPNQHSNWPNQWSS